jgi:hypothetical protein
MCVCVFVCIYVYYTVVLLLGDSLHSYQLNLKNMLCILYFCIVSLVSMETRIMCVYVCVCVCVCVWCP